MSVFHCPICPLIFAHRSEADRHLRDEHRSGSEEETELRAQLAAAAAPLDDERLRQLRASRSTPSVTLILGTTPAATMTVLDVARLRQLADRARRRMAVEPERDAPTAVMEYRLARAVSAAESMAMDRGLAVLVNQHELAIVPLPFSPRDRHVVDTAFATRDLEFALRRFPRYRVLVVGHHPRVLEGVSLLVSEVEGLPGEASAEELLQGRLRLAGELPLVLVGDRRHLDQFRQRSPHRAQVVAVAVRSRLRSASVVELAASALNRWQSEVQALRLSELRHADLREQVLWGLEPAWAAVRAGTAARMWVEHDFAVAGRVGDGGGTLRRAVDATEPGVHDDLVDALISEAGSAGIPVHLMDRGRLDHPDPVAVHIAGTDPAPLARGRSLAVA